MQHPKKAAMIAALAETGVVTVAARAAQIDRVTHYRWIKEDPEYAEAVKDAEGQAVDLMEAEAQRRAVQGTRRQIYYRGAVVGEELVYSDVLLMFLLKAARPDKYRDRVDSLGGNAPAPMIPLSALNVRILEAHRPDDGSPVLAK